MDQSKFSFATHSFRIDTQSSNPQNSTQEKKKGQNQLSFGKTNIQNELAFKKIMLHNVFAQDQSDSDESAEAQFEQLKIGKIKRNKSTGLHSLYNSKSLDQQYSPKMINLLQNCKTSILSLQQELDEKNSTIKKLQKEKESLSAKLTEAEKQIQRTHLILNIYLKENHQKVNPLPNHKLIIEPQSSIQKQAKSTQESLKCQIEQLKRINKNYLQENNKLRSEICWLQTEVSQLNTENLILNQKLQTMGKGVGKALSTIKKNNQSSRKITEFILVQQQKSLRKSREYGKISTHKSSRKITEQSFETPTKVSLQNTQQSTNQISIKSFYETSEQKMADISLKAKRLDQLEKLQSILEKMQTLAQKDSQSQNSFN